MENFLDGYLETRPHYNDEEEGFTVNPDQLGKCPPAMHQPAGADFVPPARRKSPAVPAQENPSSALPVQEKAAVPAPAKAPPISFPTFYQTRCC